MLSQFTRIKSRFSEHRRIPLLGRIRLGLKVQKTRQDGSVVEYPTETNYFVVPPEVQAVYGPQPTELDIMLPSDHEEAVFPQSLSWFGRSKGLKCKGDMETAERVNEQTGEWEKRSCPCEHYKSEQNPKGECTETGILIAILPKVNMGGTYQLRTKSFHSTVDINSGLDYIRALIGRISMVPLKLRRVARETHNDGKKQTHYTLSLILDSNIEGVNQLRNDTSRILSHAQLQIQGPIEENPAMDPPDITEVESEHTAEPAPAPANGARKAIEVLGKMKQARQGDGAGSVSDAKPVLAQSGSQQASDAPAPASTSKAPALNGHMSDDGGLDAEWLSQVLDCEDVLRGSQQGKGSLRSIRAGYHLQDGAYPLLPDDQQRYLRDLMRTVELLQPAHA